MEYCLECDEDDQNYCDLCDISKCLDDGKCVDLKIGYNVFLIFQVIWGIVFIINFVLAIVKVNSYITSWQVISLFQWLNAYSFLNHYIPEETVFLLQKFKELSL